MLFLMFRRICFRSYLMTSRMIELVAAGVVLALALMVIEALHSYRGDQQQIQTTVATQQKLIVDADTRESQRDTSVKNLVDEIAKLKTKVRTPSQVLNELPKYLPLPQPMTLGPDAAPARGSKSPTYPTSTNQGGTDATTQTVRLQSDVGETEMPTSHVVPTDTISSAPIVGAANVQLPSADLKPLFDYVQDCRACQAEITAARQDGADDSAKLAAVTRERDTALEAAKGGSVWRRLRNDLEWLAAGALSGYVAGRL
jgi:hypothetical protein